MAEAQIHGKQLLKVDVQGQPKNLLVLRAGGSTKLFEAHPLVEAFNRENGTNLKVVSHKVADVAQMVDEVWRQVPAYAVDASIAYENPGTKLGKEIVFSSEGNPRVVLSTGKYKGERDIALVALGLTSDDFKKDGNSLVLAIPENRLIAVPNFPGPDGWYMPHAETGVPHSEAVGASNDARYLSRLNSSSYVGLLVRNVYLYRQLVDAYYGASVRFGVVAEVPEGDVAKIATLLKPVEASPQAAKKEAAIKVPGFSVGELSDLAARAQGALGSLPATLDAAVRDPITQLVQAVAKATLKG